MNKKLLLLGSVVSACPPLKQGGTERVAYYQAKQLALRGISIIFVGGRGSKKNFQQQLKLEKEIQKKYILNNIEIIEIGGGTGLGTQEDAIQFNPAHTEASRKLRLEMVNLAQVQELMIKRKNEYDIILNNMRGEAIFLPLVKKLDKKLINVMHLNIFSELADMFKNYDTPLITLSHAQKKQYSHLNHLATIYNPIDTNLFSYQKKPKNYALMISTIGYHKNQEDAIKACRQAGIPLILSGKIRDNDYFEQKIAPHIDDKRLTYYGEIGFEKKLKLYQEARVFLFPIMWQEPFGLVLLEALSCGTPVIAYPHGGPLDIVKNGENGFLVRNTQSMAKAIKNIHSIKREQCRNHVLSHFSEGLIGEQYYQAITKYS